MSIYQTFKKIPNGGRGGLNEERKVDCHHQGTTRKKRGGGGYIFEPKFFSPTPLPYIDSAIGLSLSPDPEIFLTVPNQLSPPRWGVYLCIFPQGYINVYGWPEMRGKGGWIGRVRREGH